MPQTQQWTVDATCTTVHPDTLFVRGAAQQSARELCFSCPVRTPCLVEALESRTQFGIWGGMTERERRALLRHHPDVSDWAAWLNRHAEKVETPAACAARLRVARQRATA